REIETRAASQLQQGEVEMIYRGVEIMVESADRGGVEAVAVLGPEIIAVEHRAGAEQTARCLPGELAAEQHWTDRREDQRRAGRALGVGLILAPKKQITGDMMARLRFVDLRQILVDAMTTRGRGVGAGRLLEIGTGEIIRPHPEIHPAELELHPRQVG